ncbi:hypothetical protein TTY48_21650 [Tsukamurella sp. TY48]|nr:hypothetical protein TTY48_21650 [Tsukamurella sp. TY48]
MILFPDNTVLINFAHIDRMDLLAQIVGDRGSWCQTVSEECDRHSARHDLPQMTQAHEIFGVPLVPADRREHVTVQRYRDMLRSAGQGLTHNLGEAETLALIECRGLAAVLVTDDGPVGRLDLGGTPAITGTWGLLRMAYRMQLVSDDELWSYSRTLHREERHTPPTGPFDRGKFNEWLRS